MSHLAQTVAAQVLSAVRPPRLGLWARVRRHFDCLNAAHARQARYRHLGGEVCSDLALPPEAILGEGSYAPALPFFFQAGFDRH